MSDDDTPPPPSRLRAAQVIHDISDSDSDIIEPLQASASTSALSLQNSELAGTSSELRERVRAPYSATIASMREDLRAEQPVTPIATGSLKGKEREQPSSSSNLKAAAEDAATPFVCHICLEVPNSDDCVTTKCGHLFCCTSYTWLGIARTDKQQCPGSDLSAWLDSNPPATSQCPVCKSQIRDVQEEVIPIYSGGAVGIERKEIDPRTRPRPKPRVNPALPPPSRGGLFGGGGGIPGINPFWDLGAGSGWTVQAGMFPFPGVGFGWSSQPRGMVRPFDPANLPPGVTPEQAREQARIQQRNALIAFVVMIVLFSLRECC